MPAVAKKKKVETLEQRILKHARSRELGSKHYGRGDRLLEELAKEMKVGEPVLLPGGKKAELIDLYQDKLKVFRAHGIARFEIKISDAN